MIIRKMIESEFPLLADFLYEAIYVPEGVMPPPKEIIQQPELSLYIDEFGTKKADLAFGAEVDGKIVGAVWVRIMNDYGHIDNETPSFAISIFKEYRNQGIGTALMRRMLCELKNRGYQHASLSVQKENYAVSMYKNVGFYVVKEKEEEFLMRCDLNDKVK